MYVIIAIIISVISTNAYATEIDLTDFASGSGESSHSCILVDKFDDTSHWQICVVCNQIKNKGEHIKTVKTTNGTRCDETNRRITTCSSCNYILDEPAGYRHNYSHAVLRIKNGSVDVLTGWCNSFHDGESSTDGAIWTDVNGNPLDITKLKYGSTVKSPSGLITTIQDVTYTWDFTDESKVNLEIKDGYLLGNAELYIPDGMTDKFTPGLIRSSLHQVILHGVRNSNEDTGEELSVQSFEYNESLGLIKMGFKYNVKSPTVDRNRLPRVNLRCYYFSGNPRYNVSFAQLISIDNNPYNPEINRAEFNTGG